MTPLEQAKKRIFDHGITIDQWARDNHFEPTDVYRVLNGIYKGRRGKAHRIAVALGIKKEPEQLAA